MAAVMKMRNASGHQGKKERQRKKSANSEKKSRALFVSVNSP